MIEQSYPYDDLLVVGESSAAALFSNISEEETSGAMLKVKNELGDWAKHNSNDEVSS